MREYIVGDGCYPFLPWFIIHFLGAVTNAQKLFNFKLSSTRIVVERAFGKLKNTWRLLQNRVKNSNLELLPRIIIVCCILHNMLLSMETSEDEYGEEVANEKPTSFEGNDTVEFDATTTITRMALMEYVNRKDYAMEE
eukprot:Gb_07762 [translate_table: standard]